MRGTYAEDMRRYAAYVICDAPWVIRAWHHGCMSSSSHQAHTHTHMLSLFPTCTCTCTHGLCVAPSAIIWCACAICNGVHAQSAIICNVGGCGMHEHMGTIDGVMCEDWMHDHAQHEHPGHMRHMSYAVTYAAHMRRMSYALIVAEPNCF